MLGLYLEKERRYMKKLNIFLLDIKTQGKLSAAIYIVALTFDMLALTFDMLELDIQSLNFLMGFLLAISMSNLILLSYPLIEKKGVPENWKTGTAMVATTMLIANLLETSGAMPGDDIAIFYLVFCIITMSYLTAADDVIPTVWRYITGIGAFGMTVVLFESFLFSTETLGFLWISYLPLT